MRYRRKPIEVDAWQWNGPDAPDMPDWVRALEADGTVLLGAGQLRISSPAGFTYANVGDWFVRIDDGQWEVETAKAFATRYEAA